MRIDLHRHLEGSHSAVALLDVAREFDIRDPIFFDVDTNAPRRASELSKVLTMDAPSDDAMVFYACIVKARAAYVSAPAIFALARRAFLEACDDTDGCEMRVSLFSMTRTLLDNTGVDWRAMAPTDFADRCESILAGLVAARDDVRRERGKPLLLRVGFSRTFESAPHYRALGDMLKAHTKSLTGLDVLGIVAGDDKEPMPRELLEILHALRPDFPDLTIHAGEFSDHGSVDRVLDLKPQGIGHGVHSVGDDDVMNRLVSDGVTLEVCPTSNHLLIPTALSSLTERRQTHPLCALQQHGVHCVLGSDDPTPMGTTFQNEWAVATSLGVDMTTLENDIARRFAQLPK